MTIVAINGINQSKVNVTFNKMSNMTCNVESYPPAMVYWEVNGELVSNNKSVLVNTSVRGAIITYTCVAENVVDGTDRSSNNSITIIIQGKMLCDGYGISVSANSLCLQTLNMYISGTFLRRFLRFLETDQIFLILKNS